MNQIIIQQPRRDLTAAVVKRFVQIAVLIVVQAAALFVSAGRLDWVAGWVYIGLYVAFIALNAALMLPGHAELAAERGQMKEGTKAWDKIILILTALASPLILVVAGLDERWSWSPQVLLEVRLIALILMALGFGIFSWAMASNQFFSSVVRIQRDRGHVICTSGPYGLVRHPGYLGVMVYSMATPPMLGSLWAFIPAALLVGVIVVRTALEDRMLQNELQGYREYAARVRYRILPEVW